MHEAQAALRESEARLVQLAEHSDEVFWFVTLNPERVIFMSPAVEKIWGWPAAQFRAEPRLREKGVHPDDRPRVHAAYEAVLAGRAATFTEEYRVVRSDGAVRWVLDSGTPIRDAGGAIVSVAGVTRDITERKQAETALQLSEFSVSHASAPTYWIARDARILRVNRAACELLGYTEAELLALAVTDLEPGFPAARWPAHWEELRERKRMSFETQHRRKDGSVFPVEVDLNWFEFEGREYNFAFARDISGRKRAEETVRQATDHMARDRRRRVGIELAMLATLVVAVYALAARFDWFKAATGWVLTQAFKQMDALILAGLALVAGLSVIAFRRWRETELELTGNQQVQVALGLLHDELDRRVKQRTAELNNANQALHGEIMERKQTEEALRESETRFKSVTRAVSDAIWDWNLPTNTFWRSDGFLTTFGFAAGEVEPTIEFWSGRIHPEERSKVVESIHHAIAGGAESWNAEYRFQRKDGGHASVQDRAYILRDAAGKGIRMVGGMRDLTEQKKMEVQYLRAQRMDSIGSLASGIAHDLNNVLAPIMMSIELLKLNNRTEPQRAKTLEIIHASSRRGADLVRQVLTFARGLDSPRVSIRLRRLISDLEGMVCETFPRNIRIVIRVPNDLWPITGDPTQLHQVLLNLAVNARDAMPQGGTLILAASNLTIDAHQAGLNPEAKPGPYVLFKVTDTGLGIPPEVQGRIFELFFTTKQPGKGTGIGLASVHTIVKNHGGFLNFKSESGRGTTFNVYLPADPDHQNASSMPPFQADLPRGRDELVLVVDDEYSIRDITRQTLEAFGYRVITASDGAKAVVLYTQQAQEIALVLTDMMMPVMDGVSAIQVFMRINPAIKIIAASGIDSGGNSSRASNAGVKHFLLKPYTAETLLKLIREVLDQPMPPAPR